MDKMTRLHDRYEIQEILGYGGFATTYLAVDVTTQQHCAIKCLAFKKIAQWKTWELFEREMKILKNLQHPQIPRYIDSFTHETEFDIELYLVQQYIEGKSLFQLLQEGKHFGEHDVLDITLKITQVLEYLHSFSPPIIHRDIKPNNIIITPEHQVFLIDFGSVREKILLDYTVAGGGSTIIGTYGYMPREQFLGRALPTSDIYALGMTIICLLSCKTPLELDIKNEQVNFRAHTSISRSFATVIDRMIAPESVKRYQTVQRLQHDLRRLIAGRIIFPLSSVIKIAIPGTLAILLLLGWEMFGGNPLSHRSQVVPTDSPTVPSAPPTPLPTPHRAQQKQVPSLPQLTVEPPVVWYENDVELSLSSISLGIRSGEGRGGLSKRDLTGNYQREDRIYALTLFFTVANRTSKNISVPLNIRRVIDETGRKVLPNTQQFMFPGTGGLMILAGSTFYDQEVVFVVPEGQASFIFTTGGEANFHFKVTIENNTAMAQRIETLSNM